MKEWGYGEYWVAYCQAQKNANKIHAEKSSHSSGCIIADIKLRLWIAVSQNQRKANMDCAKKYLLSPRKLLSGGGSFVVLFRKSFAQQKIPSEVVNLSLYDEGTFILISYLLRNAK